MQHNWKNIWHDAQSEEGIRYQHYMNKQSYHESVTSKQRLLENSQFYKKRENKITEMPGKLVLKADLSQSPSTSEMLDDPNLT